MEFSWTIFVLVAVVANPVCMMIMYLGQQMDRSLPPRRSLIPGTHQAFIYMEDFHTMLWGDVIAVPLIITGFIHVAVQGLPLAEWLILFGIAIVDALGFLLICLGPNHKPDQGFPQAGKVSWNGLLHLPYHGFGVAMSILAIWHACWGELNGVPLHVALVGGAIYIISFIADIRAGNFDPLKRIEK